MKRTGIGLAFLCFMLCFSGCRRSTAFTATVLSVSEDSSSMTVEAYENETLGGLFVVNVKNAKIQDAKGDYPLEEIGPGDRVKIVFDGTTLDSYPAQITAGRVTLKEYHSASFSATIVETSREPGSIMVEPAADTAELKSADRISVGILDAVIYGTGETAWIDGALTPRDLRVGDAVTVCYDGIIAESYPAQITSCTLLLVER